MGRRNGRGNGRRGGRRDGSTLVIIGGHEDKDGDKLILRHLAERIGGGKLVVATVASDVPGELWETYEPLFRGLGVRHVHKLDVETREEAMSERKLRVLDDADGVFFTGGDQLKITSLLGDSPIFQRLHEIYDGGGVIAGTSAGASAMTETMLVRGAGSSSFRIGDLQMAPGLGLVSGLVVDQHFAERGRVGRLMGAVAQNPANLGIGIDEDTAIVLHPGPRGPTFRVLGSGAVYVVDGSGVTYCNLTEEETDRTLSVFGVCLHVLSQGDEFDCAERRPTNHPAEALEDAGSAM